MKSMTGYGRGEAQEGAWCAEASIKTVNHRYADISVRMSRRYQFAEDRIKKIVRASVVRGKADIQIDIESDGAQTVDIKPDIQVAKAYYMALRELEKEVDVSGGISLEFLASQQDVLAVSAADIDEEAVISACEKAISVACAELDAMRVAEGRELAADIAERADTIESLLAQIEERMSALPAIYAEKLTSRIAELSGAEPDSELLASRIAIETAIIADKCSITEETVRLRSHIARMRELLTIDDASGKKMDFIMQEMNREANTIGSKANDLRVMDIMLEIKSETEKIREQVQNIE